MKQLILTLLMAGLLAAPVMADSIVLNDGTELQGRIVESESGYDLHMEDGSVRFLASSDIMAVEFQKTMVETYYHKAEAIAEDGSADSHYELALWALKNKLGKQSQRQFQTAVQINPDHENAQIALGNVKVNDVWMNAQDAMIARGFVEYNGRWITQEEMTWMTNNQTVTQNKNIFSSDMNNEQLRAEIKRLVRSLPKDEQQTLVTSGMTHSNDNFRKYCMKELGRFPNEDAYQSLVRGALLDAKRDVRLAAVNSLQRISETTNNDLVVEMEKALKDERALVQFAAIDALANIGGPSGVRVLVNQYRVTYSGGPRSFIAIMNQLSYIEDYDVQVATGSTIADPVIGVLQTGQVMDVQPLRITEYVTEVQRTMVWTALNKIRGEDGDQPASLEEFEAWWSKTRLDYE